MKKAERNIILASFRGGEISFNSRYVYAHSEFTPQETMRGKMALYGYLYAIDKKWSENKWWSRIKRKSEIRSSGSISKIGWFARFYLFLRENKKEQEPLGFLLFKGDN